MEQNIEFNCRGNTATSGKLKMNIDLGSMSSYKEQFIAALEEEYSEYKKKGMDVKVSSTDNTITVDASIEKDELSTIASISINSENYDKVKEELEEQGYSCK